MRLVLLAAATVLCLPMISCTKDPDLDPQPKLPESTSRQIPWNRPISGQGGGPLGTLPNQQLRR